ncbi:hypothetical protein ISS03_01685 [Patescibacteria group bacterium]|nr:hypothetical protein [Patescibacteria group bacterium]
MEDAKVISGNNIGEVVVRMGVQRDREAEDYLNSTIVERVVAEVNIDVATREKFIKFITYGTKSTKTLGAGERAGVINSYRSAFSHFPESVEDWNDVIKIANGRWPSNRSEIAEDKAKIEFEKVYRRAPIMRDSHDNAAVTIIAYGLRPANRSLVSETAALATFKAVYLHIPTSAQDWDIIRAVAYSGARRGINN